MPTVFNAANELAVSRFLNRQIPYLAITEIIESAMDYHRLVKNPAVDEILETEKAVYEYIESRW